MAPKIDDIKKRGWAKPLEAWLRLYVNQFTSTFGPIFNNAKANANTNAKAARAIAKARGPVFRYTVEQATSDLKKFRNSKIDTRLRAHFNSKIATFATNMVKSMMNMNTGTVSSRRKAHFAVDEKIRNHLTKVVNKLKPVSVGTNRVRRYQLNKNYKLALGTIREVL